MSFIRVTPTLVSTWLLLACADDGSTPDEGVGDDGETADTDTGETADVGADTTGIDSEVLAICETLCLDSGHATCNGMNPNYDPDTCVAACVSVFAEIEAECTVACYDAYLAVYECLGAAPSEDLDPDTCGATEFCAEPSSQQLTACGDCSAG